MTVNPRFFERIAGRFGIATTAGIISADLTAAIADKNEFIRFIWSNYKNVAGRSVYFGIEDALTDE